MNRIRTLNLGIGSPRDLGIGVGGGETTGSYITLAVQEHHQSKRDESQKISTGKYFCLESFGTAEWKKYKSSILAKKVWEGREIGQMSAAHTV